MINIFDRTLKIMARNHAATFLKLAFPHLAIRLPEFGIEMTRG